MNIVICSGRLVRNARVNGDKTKAVKFIVACKYGYDSKAGEDLVEFVPCVMFTKPNDKLGIFLVGEGKGVFVEFEGRVATSQYEKDKETRFNTEVIVDKRTFNIITK